MVIWLIGISGAGKTTVGTALCAKMRAAGRSVIMLDGDELRLVWGDVTTQDLTARRLNHERISRLCVLLDQNPGVDLVVPALSIFPDLRAWNRKNISGYVEVFLDVSIETARGRDKKGIYERALRGELKNVAGLDIPFPPPLAADLRIAEPDIFEAPELIADRIYDFLGKKGGKVSKNV